MFSLKQRCIQPTNELLQGKDYLYIDNGANVLAVAHCDYVDCKIGHKFKKKGNLVYNTRLDDRLGVHIILDALPALGINVDVLLTNDEEIGQSTAKLFTPHKEYNWMFQFDRRGTDAVCYEYDVMEEYVEKHFKLGVGSFSDICWLDHLGCGGFNIGTGYYNEHTTNSFANLDHTKKQIKRFLKFWGEFKDTKIAYEKEEKEVYKYENYGLISEEDYEYQSQILGYESVWDMARDNNISLEEAMYWIDRMYYS